VLGLVLAGAVAVPRRGWALDTAAVATPIQALNQGLVAVMQAGRRVSFRDRFHTLAPTIDRAFDLAGILRTSVGPRWGDVEAAQQADLLKMFRRFTVASYIANFDSYDGQRFEIAPALRTIGTDQVVSTTLVPTSGDTIRIDYVMRQVGADWKIVDVLLDGTISRVAVQRSDFRGVMAQGGAPALVASLERKVVDMAGSALES
jgi:phospholipid transport system substrate-binding protein